ncbi:NADP-dependent oxidoreductase [Streptomyces tsukubensis]|uniref:NADPH:quinone reductase n=1 Tax=Streptomyces tsukubensis TaxID=83656 RepID=A0A1V4A6V2_9ACTN|nr:NADP-dependent oxidoreductase [Streptomyces tsukubensis]OON77020.1 NADPH:quinone reductase [Streptomyces tsukubensis]QFR93741.1 zinc-binding dehydrogenase [Streptomyces tsukubensis]
MKAIVFDTFGGTEVLHETEIEAPQPGSGQVRVRVRAVGVNPVDGKIRSGTMEAIFPTTLPAVPGGEIAGTVDALGAGVDHLKVGDEVLGWSDTGSYAQYALADPAVLAPKPAGLDWPHAAALPVASDGADRVLDLLDVKAGETLLIHGASGALGTLTVQLAVARGAHVIGTAGPANQEYVTSLGATALVYGDGLLERVRAVAPNGVDAVVDAAGKGSLEDSITLRGGTDRIVTTADFRARELGIVFAEGPQRRSGARLAELARQAADGTLAITVGATHPLADAAQAQQASDAGHSRGKLVLTVD